MKLDPIISKHSHHGLGDKSEKLILNIALCFVLIVLMQSIVFAQKEDSSIFKIYETVTDHAISKTIGGGDLSINSFYYSVKLFSDSTFEYLTYQKIKDGQIIDSLKVEGKYVIKGRRIYFIHEQYFKTNAGIKWILKKSHILVKGFATRRTKLILKNSSATNIE